MSPTKRGTTTDVRRRNRRDFLSLLASSALVIAVTAAIWAVTGAGSFWPIWVIFGLGVVLAGSAWRSFGPEQSRKRDEPQRQLDRD